MGTIMVAEKRAVVFSYSQTGQLTETVRAFTDALVEAGWQIRRVAVTPAEPYPFPWPVRKFFGVFPDSVDEQAVIDLDTTSSELRVEPGELVILAYQVWFLAPSLPMRTLLNAHPDLFADRDVLSVIACRNMWYSAAVEVGRRLETLGARHLGAVVATDTRPQFVTMVTTLRWLLGGKREAGGIFGRAGIDDRELTRVRDCGTDWAAGTPDVTGTQVVYPIAGADLFAGKLFRRWGALIRAAARRGPVLRAITLTAFVGTLATSVLLMPLLALLALPMHRRIDRATDRALTGIVGLRGLPGSESTDRPTATSSHLANSAVDRVPELCRDGYLLMYGEDRESAWLDAVGYVRMMNTTPVACIAVSRDRASDDSTLSDPSGEVLAGYGLGGSTAVLLRPDAKVAAVLPGTDPHQELIRAIQDAARNGTVTAQPDQIAQR
ncbi:hypothetical protein ACFQZZ_19525 [Nocardia sp. GCM10030253]|uniref:hypothetical protein n=1 Tax=Nocardia sp. GCM10030253 TaxID=3273404 RepID=UPI003637C8E8